jgi:hypothetical protein
MLQEMFVDLPAKVLSWKVAKTHPFSLLQHPHPLASADVIKLKRYGQ